MMPGNFGAFRNVMERILRERFERQRHAVPRERRAAFVKPKPREPRTPVMLNALLRGGGQERSVRVRNVSSRGMMIEAHEAGEAPDVGVVVEVRIGGVSWLGRVAWSRGKQFGFHCRSTIDTGLLVGGCGVREGRRADARACRSAASLCAQDYRFVSRAMQFVAGVGFAVASCAIIVLLLNEMLLAPMQTLSAHLSR